MFERSKIPLHKWLLATALMCSSKKGISSHQLHRTLDVTYKTAWFMAHRIREAMKEENPGKLGGDGPHGLPSKKRKPEDRDKPKKAKRWGGSTEDKAKVFALVERSTGRVRSFHVADVTADTLRPIIWGNIDRKATIHTDESSVYSPRTLGRYQAHHSVNHSDGEYVRGTVTTNLVRYLAEFDFRYSNREIDDAERTNAALAGIEGKRLTYYQASSQAHA